MAADHSLIQGTVEGHSRICLWLKCTHNKSNARTTGSWYLTNKLNRLPLLRWTQNPIVTSTMLLPLVHGASLITCGIARSNPGRLFSFNASGNAGHYQSTMTSHNDPRMWCHERWVCFLPKMPNKRAYCTTHTRVYHITRWSPCMDLSKFSHRDR